MTVYRIVSQKSRTTDLSGIGAYKAGGRWNNPGTYALYTSENRSLATSELLVHLDESETPPNLFIMSIKINETAPIFVMSDNILSNDWRSPENSATKNIGNQLLSGNKYLALKVRSAIMPYEYNYILNPRFPTFKDFVKITDVVPFSFDERLL